MIYRDFVTGSSSTFPFRIRVDGVYVDLTSYTILFVGKGNSTGAISYTLVHDAATPTVIYVPYATVVSTNNVALGTFDITTPSGTFERSEPLHITKR